MTVHKVPAIIGTGLGHRHTPVVLALAAFVMFLPTLKMGLLLDDYIHWGIIAGPSEIPEQLRDTGLMYGNAGGLSAAVFHQFGVASDKTVVTRCRDYGLFPWWVRDDIRGGLWRPLTSFTHWLDYRLAPRVPGFMHAHSVLWFSGIVFLAAILYRRFTAAAWLAGLAGVMYLLDKNSYFPTMFIANRNALTAIFFGILALLAHHKWRTARSLSAAVLTQICLLLSLLSGEGGVATFAYLFAYAAALEEGRVIRRGLSLVPAVAVITVWRLVYNGLGYGMSGFGLYVDPVNDPIRYMLAVVERAPILLASQLGCQSPEMLMAASDSVKNLAWFVGVLTLVVIIALLIPLLRKNRLARFWFIAMTISVLPFCAVFPSGRTLLLTGIATSGLIAVFFGSLLSKESGISVSRPWRTAAWALCGALLFVHLPVAAVERAVAPKMTTFFTNAMSSVMQVGSPQATEGKDVVIVNTASPLFLAHMPFVRAYHGQPLPRSARTLVPGLRPLTIRRTGPNTLVIRAIGGDIFSCRQDSPIGFVHVFRTFNELFLSDKFRFRVNDKVILPRLAIEVSAVDEKFMPTEILFTFSDFLDDASLCWYQFNWNRLSYSPFNMPAIGEEVQVAGPSHVSLGSAMRHIMKLPFRR